MSGIAKVYKKITIVRPGVVSIGKYSPGKIYSVEEKEANRLVKNKGFKFVIADENRDD